MGCYSKNAITLFLLFCCLERHIPRANTTDRVVPVGHGRGRRYTLLGAAVPQTDPTTRLGRDIHHGRLDAQVYYHTPAVQVSLKNNNMKFITLSPRHNAKMRTNEL